MFVRSTRPLSHLSLLRIARPDLKPASVSSSRREPATIVWLGPKMPPYPDFAQFIPACIVATLDRTSDPKAQRHKPNVKAKPYHYSENEIICHDGISALQQVLVGTTFEVLGSSAPDGSVVVRCGAVSPSCRASA